MSEVILGGQSPHLMAKHKQVGIVGFRLAHGLHLGHLIGNLEPAITALNDHDIFVILADLFTLTSKRDVCKANLISVIADCMATGLTGENVHFVLQSGLSICGAGLFSIIGELVNVNQLRNVVPNQKQMRDTPERFSVAQYFFPVVQTAEMVGLRANKLFSNTDNMGIVTFAGIAIKRLNARYGLDYPQPTLSYGTIPFLPGIDRRKMSHANKNYILLSDSDDTIFDKIKKMRTDPPDASDNYEVSADHSQVFLYCSALGMPKQDIDKLRIEYQNGITTSLNIKKQLSQLIINRISPIREKRSALLSKNAELLWNRMIGDTAASRAVVYTNVAEIMGRALNGITEPI